MPIIAKPRMLMVYLVQRLEEQGVQPTIDTLAQICASVQTAGHHIYSFATDPQDTSLKENIAQDVQEGQASNWFQVRENQLYLTNRGRDYVQGAVPTQGLLANINEILISYKPKE